MPEASSSLTLRAYAKHRGVSAMAVSRAVKSGRLRKCVLRDAHGRPEGVSSAELADREWEEATDLSRAPGTVKEAAAKRAARAGAPPDPGGGGGEEPPRPGDPNNLSLAAETAREKYWKANHAELEYRERLGQLVEAKDVAKTLADVFATCRTKLLAVPIRARQALPHLTAQDVAALENLVREALEELANLPADPEDSDQETEP
jgi:hypothetical protein